MTLDDLLQRYFGTRDPGALDPQAMPAALERIRVDFGMERDRGRRFALWSLLFMLGEAPDLDVAFEAESDREAARNLMDMMAAAGDPEAGS